MANEKHQIDVELEEAVAQGTYANLAIISHSTSEFVLDFAAVLPGVPKAKVKSRIILAPEHAKRLLCEGAHTTSQVSEMCGYRDIAYFCRVFKQNVGVTPAAWRDTH